MAKKPTNLGYTAVLKPGEGVVVVINGKSYPIAHDAVNYEPLVNALRDGKKVDEIKKFVTPKKALVSTAKAHGFDVRVNEKDDTIKVFCDGKQITGMIADHIVELVRSSKGFETLERFVQKAITNRDPDAIDDLYKFIEHNGCTLHPDGDILAFKAVKDTYYDHHTGQVLYALGTYVEKDRKDCDPDPHRDCSNGLHVGGRRYVENFHAHSGRVLIVKVNPADWIAVPAYDHGKARVCKMYVYAEIPRAEMGNALNAFVEVIPDGERRMKAENKHTFNATDARPQEKAQMAAMPVPKKAKGIILEHAATGKKIALKALLTLVKKIGQRAAARSLNIPRTTIQEWLKAHS